MTPLRYKRSRALDVVDGGFAAGDVLQNKVAPALKGRRRGRGNFEDQGRAGFADGAEAFQTNVVPGRRRRHHHGRGGRRRRVLRRPRRRAIAGVSDSALATGAVIWVAVTGAE